MSIQVLSAGATAGTAVAGGNGVNAIVVMTAAAYAALGTKVATTMYVIVG